ncbi:MAG TPA: alpha/beta hydrolase [Lysobacter sp.]
MNDRSSPSSPSALPAHARPKSATALAVTIATAIGASTSLHAATPLDIPGFMAIPRPMPTLELQYGEATSQGIDVFIPEGKGPFPVVVLIHGGCWSETTAPRHQLRHLGAELAKHGIATWSIGYRRANEKGGGYPGTFLDVGVAIDRLRDDAARYRFDLSRTVLVGHSAGGHLALWAASREQLPETSQLRVAAPFVPRKVVSLAGIGDLKIYAPLITSYCGASVGTKLIGAPSAQRPDVYADTSPAALPPKGADIVMVSGTLDRLVPPYVAHDYARQVQDSSSVRRVNLEEAGHFDLVATPRPAWNHVRDLIESALTP